MESAENQVVEQDDLTILDELKTHDENIDTELTKIEEKQVPSVAASPRVEKSNVKYIQFLEQRIKECLGENKRYLLKY